MARAVQKRTLETRARLIAAAQELIAEHGYQALRVEEIVLGAGVAKGTFFAHFRDKDALMDLIIGDEIEAQLDRLDAAPVPGTIPDMVDMLMPLYGFMTCEAYVFGVILRYSGVTDVDDIGVIARTFQRQTDVVSRWLSQSRFRTDISPELQSEGVQAFAIQSMALKFCALHSDQSVRDRLVVYLDAWLRPTPGTS